MTLPERTSVDWAAWLRRWDAQQQAGIPRREERFTAMLELVAEVAGPEPGAILDLACGPGSISARALRRFPTVRLVALDVDPFLLAIGQHALGDGAGRLTWVRADLRDPDWPAAVQPHAPFDAVLSSTALHWLAAADLLRVYRGLATVVRPGGLFLNADHLRIGPPASVLSAAAERVRRRLDEAERGAGESWEAWWAAARAEPAFRDLLAERSKVFTDHPRHDEYVAASFHQEALALAGFAETAVVWRRFDDTIVAALR